MQAAERRHLPAEILRSTDAAAPRLFTYDNQLPNAHALGYVDCAAPRRCCAADAATSGARTLTSAGTANDRQRGKFSSAPLPAHGAWEPALLVTGTTISRHVSDCPGPSARPTCHA